MNKGCKIRRPLPNLLLAAILLAAQVGVVLHAAGHEPGVPQTTVCKSCIAADQLAAASIDQQGTTDLDLAGSRLVVTQASDFRSIHALSARQRGPPVSS